MNYIEYEDNPRTERLQSRTQSLGFLVRARDWTKKNGGVFAVLSDNFQLERLEDLDLLVRMGQEYGHHQRSSVNQICNHHHHHHHHQSLSYLAVLSRR